MKRQSYLTPSVRRLPKAPLPFNLPSLRREAGGDGAGGGIAGAGAKWASPRPELVDHPREDKPDETPPKAAWGGAGIRAHPPSDFPDLTSTSVTNETPSVTSPSPKPLSASIPDDHDWAEDDSDMDFSEAVALPEVSIPDVPPPVPAQPLRSLPSSPAPPRLLPPQNPYRPPNHPPPAAHWGHAMRFQQTDLRAQEPPPPFDPRSREIHPQMGRQRDALSPHARTQDSSAHDNRLQDMRGHDPTLDPRNRPRGPAIRNHEFPPPHASREGDSRPFEAHHLDAQPIHPRSPQRPWVSMPKNSQIYSPGPYDPRRLPARRNDNRTHDSRGQDPRTQDLTHQDPRNQDHQSQDPRTMEPPTHDSRAHVSLTQDPRNYDPRNHDPRSHDHRTNDVRTHDPRTYGPVIHPTGSHPSGREGPANVPLSGHGSTNHVVATFGPGGHGPPRQNPRGHDSRNYDSRQPDLQPKDPRVHASQCSQSPSAPVLPLGQSAPLPNEEHNAPTTNMQDINFDLKAIEEQKSIMKSKAELAQEARRKAEEERDRIQKERSAKKLRELEERLNLKDVKPCLPTPTDGQPTESSRSTQSLNPTVYSSGQVGTNTPQQPEHSSASPTVVLSRPKVEPLQMRPRTGMQMQSMPERHLPLDRSRPLKGPPPIHVAPNLDISNRIDGLMNHGGLQSVPSRHNPGQRYPRYDSVRPYQQGYDSRNRRANHRARDYDGPAENETREQWLDRRRKKTETRDAVRSVIDLIINRAVYNYRSGTSQKRPHRHMPHHNAGPHAERREHNRRDVQRGTNFSHNAHYASRPVPPHSKGEILRASSRSLSDEENRSGTTLPMPIASLSSNPSPSIQEESRSARIPNRPVIAQMVAVDTLPRQPPQRRPAPPPLRPAPWAPKPQNGALLGANSPSIPSHLHGEGNLQAPKMVPPGEVHLPNPAMQHPLPPMPSSIIQPHSLSGTIGQANVSQIPAPKPVSCQRTLPSESKPGMRPTSDHQPPASGSSPVSRFSPPVCSPMASVQEQAKSVTISPPLGGNVTVLKKPNNKNDVGTGSNISIRSKSTGSIASTRSGNTQEMNRGRGGSRRLRGSRSDYTKKERRYPKASDGSGASMSSTEENVGSKALRGDFPPDLTPSSSICRDEREESKAWAASSGPSPPTSFDEITRAFSNQPAAFPLVGAPMIPPVPVVPVITPAPSAGTASSFDVKHNTWSTNKSWVAPNPTSEVSSEWWPTGDHRENPKQISGVTNLSTGANSTNLERFSEKVSAALEVGHGNDTNSISNEAVPSQTSMRNSTHVSRPPADPTVRGRGRRGGRGASRRSRKVFSGKSDKENPSLPFTSTAKGTSTELDNTEKGAPPSLGAKKAGTSHKQRGSHSHGRKVKATPSPYAKPPTASAPLPSSGIQTSNPFGDVKGDMNTGVKDLDVSKRQGSGRPSDEGNLESLVEGGKEISQAPPENDLPSRPRHTKPFPKSRKKDVSGKAVSSKRGGSHSEASSRGPRKLTIEIDSKSTYPVAVEGSAPLGLDVDSSAENARKMDVQKGRAPRSGSSGDQNKRTNSARQSRKGDHTVPHTTRNASRNAENQDGNRSEKNHNAQSGDSFISDVSAIPSESMEKPTSVEAAINSSKDVCETAFTGLAELDDEGLDGKQEGTRGRGRRRHRGARSRGRGGRGRGRGRGGRGRGRGAGATADRAAPGNSSGSSEPSIPKAVTSVAPA